jgi:hypothetical protein
MTRFIAGTRFVVGRMFANLPVVFDGSRPWFVYDEKLKGKICICATREEAREMAKSMNELYGPEDRGS